MTLEKSQTTQLHLQTSLALNMALWRNF